MEMNPAPGALSGRIILISGAGAGFGRACALAAANHGAELVLVGRRAERLEAVADEIEAQGGHTPHLHAMDFATAEWADYLALAHALADQFGRLDGLLNNAAILGDRAPILHYDAATWQKVMAVNVNAPFMLTRACLGLLGQSAAASVVFVSSGVGRRGYAHWGAYCASKFAIEGLSQVLAEETAENTNIRVNAFNPGGMRTSMRAAAFPGEDPDTLPKPEDVAPAVVWLLSDASAPHTGQSFDRPTR